MSKPTDIICPRCGYDLSGMAAAWDISCPLAGTCSECGHGYAWADVFDITRQNVPGFFEHERGAFERLYKSALRTCAWVVFWRFWTRISVDHRVVPRRLALFLPAIILPLHILAAAASAVRIVRINAPRVPGALSYEYVTWSVVSSLTYPMLTLRSRGGWRVDIDWWLNEWPASVVFVLGMHAMFFVLLGVLPTTRKLARLRMVHVLRALVYGGVILAILSLFRLARNVGLLVEVLVSAGIGTQSFNPRVYRLNNVDGVLLGIVLTAPVALWWLMAMKQGWRIEKAGLLWLLLCIPALLAGAACVVWILR